MTDQDIEAVAEAIYETHRTSAPEWSKASADIRSWVRAQAIAAITVMERPQTPRTAA